MWVVVMLVIASLAGAGVYWISLATLPEDDILRERADRWRERLEDLGLRLDRIQPLADGGAIRSWFDGLTTRLRGLAARIEDLGSRVEDLARRRGPHGDRPEPLAEPPMDAPTATDGRSAGASPIVPAAAVAVESAPLTSTSALEAPAAERPWRSRLTHWSWPSGRGDGALTAAEDPTGEDVADADGVLYVPVVVDRPDAHTRLFGLLGIVILVIVAGGILALGVWQSIHLIARVLDNVAGG